jgi:hypothetical protein
MPQGRDHCPHTPRCQLVRQLQTESALRFCQEVYCHADFGSCARFHHIKIHGSTPPEGLLPNGRLRVARG